MKCLVVLLFVLMSFQVVAEEQYLVPIKNSQRLPVEASRAYTNYETVCVQENCYYVVDNETAAQMVKSGMADSYEPSVERYFFATPEQTTEIRGEQWMLSKDAIGWHKAKEYTDLLPDATNNSGKSVLAVMDTGADPHEDLAEVLWKFGDVYGLTYEDNFTGSMSARDQIGHGTHVSGIAGASMLNGGMASTGYGKVNILGMKLSSARTISSVEVLKAIDKLIELKKSGVPVTVVNMSFGGPEYSTAEYLAMKSLYEAGIIVVASAGNNKEDIGKVPVYPASHNFPNIIVVAALDQGMKLAAEYSNYGGATSIAAPGSDIYSTDLRYLAKYSRVGAAYTAYDSDIHDYSSAAFGDGWTNKDGIASYSVINTVTPPLVFSILNMKDDESHAFIVSVDTTILSNYPYQMYSIEYESEYKANSPLTEVPYAAKIKYYDETCINHPDQSYTFSLPREDIMFRFSGSCAPTWEESVVNKTMGGISATGQKPVIFWVNAFSNASYFRIKRLFMGGSLYPDSYIHMGGTSMAAPFVAGAVAAAKAIHPNITNKELIGLLYTTSRHILPTEQVKNGNQIDLYAFFKAVSECRSDQRSEERRVGKECRSRWSPYH